MYVTKVCNQLNRLHTHIQTQTVTLVRSSKFVMYLRKHSFSGAIWTYKRTYTG